MNVYNVHVLILKNIHLTLSPDITQTIWNMYFFHELHLRHSQDVRTSLWSINDKPESSIGHSSYVAV